MPILNKINKTWKYIKPTSRKEKRNIPNKLIWIQKYLPQVTTRPKGFHWGVIPFIQGKIDVTI